MNIFTNKEDDWKEIEIEILDNDDEYDELFEDIEYLYYDDSDEDIEEEERIIH